MGVRLSSTHLSHVDRTTGKATMVDVADKEVTRRTAIARGRIVIGAEAYAQVRDNTAKKGDVLTVARIAGIQAAKQTSSLIPLCHPLALTKVHVECRLSDRPEDAAVEIECMARCTGQTGVEMEALTGATVAALTVFDMCKAVGRGMIIEQIRVVEKTGGKSGSFVSPGPMDRRE